MFAKLTGIVSDTEGGDIIIDVNGVGYLVSCPTSVHQAAKLDQPISLFVETVIREDAINLYGFSTKLDREWFRLFQAKVSGVGAKLSISILSHMTPADITKAIIAKDHVSLTKIPGIGAKVAQRIIAELQGKIPEGSEISGLTEVAPAAKRLFDDAVSALTNLGYPKEKAAQVVADVLATEGEEATAQSIIRKAMRAIAIG